MIPNGYVSLIVASMLLACLAGCAGPARQSAAGSRQTVSLRQPPLQAAACFARNAEAHSSALVAETRASSDDAEVIVRVRNGVLYGSANFQRAGSGSTATIVLRVTTTGRPGDLLDSLVEGC